MTILAGTLLGRYEIRSPLGKGGMGEVYLARDTTLDRTVALKVLPADVASDQQRMQRFTQEAKAVSALNHQNILTIYEIGEADGIRFLATEFIDGATLRQRITNARMTLSEALDVTTQVAGALTAAHAAGIVHRDIKPENIMVRPDGHVKVLDFGLAKLTERPVTNFEAPTVISTEPGVVMGTAQYMSPEQARGIDVDERTDIWSVGVVLYEMLTGRVPFEGATASDAVASILKDEPPPLAQFSPEIPAALQQIVTKTLSKDREERYQTIKDLLVDLRRLKQELEFEAKLGRSKQSASNSKASAPEISGQTAVGTSHKPVRQRAAALALATLIIAATAAAYLYSARNPKAEINSIAVLPFVNVDADANTEYISDGITENIINRLSQLPNLKVIARNSVIRYKGKELDPRTVGNELGVSALLMGRIVQRGDALFISTELLDARDNKHLWGEQYNRKLSDIFAVQEEISKGLTEKLQLRLSGEEMKQLTKRYTENIEAYQAYVSGRYFLNKRTPEGFKKAIEYFQQAIEKDPAYALAYSGLADSYTLLGVFRVQPRTEVFPKARAAALRALELDEKIAEPYASLAVMKLWYEWDFSGSEREFRRAIEINPNYATAHHWYAFYLATVGRQNEAIQEISRAQELDPLSPIISSDIGAIYTYARQFDRAEEQLRKTIEMDPNFVDAHVQLGDALRYKGMYKEAIAEMQKAMSLSEGKRNTVPEIALIHAISGRRDEALKMLDELKHSSKQDLRLNAYAIMIYIHIGEKDKAFEGLEKEYEERSDWILATKSHPIFDSLRSDPRFADLVRRVGFPP